MTFCRWWGGILSHPSNCWFRSNKKNWQWVLLICWPKQNTPTHKGFQMMRHVGGHWKSVEYLLPFLTSHEAFQTWVWITDFSTYQQAEEKSWSRLFVFTLIKTLISNQIKMFKPGISARSIFSSTRSFFVFPGEVWFEGIPHKQLQCSEDRTPDFSL